jgi:hypothetical protein
VVGYRLPEKLPQTEVLYVNDHYDPAHLEKLVGEQKSWIVSDFHWQLPPTNRQTLCYPYFLIALCDQARREILPMPHEYITTGCFNFMVYKARPLRRVFLELLQYFKLSTNFYTANIGQHMKPLEITHSDPEISVFLDYRKITPLTLPARVIATKVEQGHNISHYSNFLERRVFGPSAVALITEPLEPEWDNSMNFSEKTIFAMLGCNLPIWVGGVNQASLWASAGFDTFDDVIDHSYQSAETSQQRMELAIERNLRILTDLDHAKKMRELHMPRLLENRSRLLGQSVRPYLDQIKNSFPSHIQIIIEDIEKSWIKKT